MPDLALSTHYLQCIWPITDEAHTQAELVAEATPHLEKFADRARAVLTGPPRWTVKPAADVLGWEAYAPGSVLIATAPADRVLPKAATRTPEYPPLLVEWAQKLFRDGHGYPTVMRETGLPERCVRGIYSELKATRRLAVGVGA